jgi:hypothetical protein
MTVSEHKGPRCPVTFADESTATAVSYEGEVLSVVCDRAHPPGRPLDLTLDTAEGPVPLRAKSAGSKRRTDGLFDVRLRLHSLRREDRERLDRAFATRE